MCRAHLHAWQLFWTKIELATQKRTNWRSQHAFCYFFDNKKKHIETHLSNLANMVWQNKKTAPPLHHFWEKPRRTKHVKKHAKWKTAEKQSKITTNVENNPKRKHLSKTPKTWGETKTRKKGEHNSAKTRKKQQYLTTQDLDSIKRWKPANKRKMQELVPLVWCRASP